MCSSHAAGRVMPVVASRKACLAMDGASLGALSLDAVWGASRLGEDCCQTSGVYLCEARGQRAARLVKMHDRWETGDWGHLASYKRVAQQTHAMIHRSIPERAQTAGAFRGQAHERRSTCVSPMCAADVEGIGPLLQRWGVPGTGG